MTIPGTVPPRYRRDTSPAVFLPLAVGEALNVLRMSPQVRRGYGPQLSPGVAMASGAFCEAV